MLQPCAIDECLLRMASEQWRARQNQILKLEVIYFCVQPDIFSDFIYLLNKENVPLCSIQNNN